MIRETASVLVEAPAFANKIDADVNTTLKKCAPDTAAWKTAYRYFRFYVDAPKSNDSCMQLSDIMLIDAGGNEISSNNFTLAWDTNAHGLGEAYPSGEAPGNAVDGNHGTKWLDFRAGTGRTAEQRAAVYIEFRFDSATNIYGYRWYTANDSSDRDPAAWHITASNDGVSWTTLDVVSGYNPTTDRMTLAFERYFAELCAFRHYRFKVDEVLGDGNQYMQISDVGLYGAEGARLILGTVFTLTGEGETFDANAPSVVATPANCTTRLSIPYLCDRESYDTAVWKATRRMVLSKDGNPWFFSGAKGEGVGSPHTGYGRIWPMSIAMRTLVSRDKAEMAYCISALLKTTGGRGAMHESFDVNDDSRFSRGWFAWADGLFAEAVIHTYKADAFQ